MLAMTTSKPDLARFYESLGKAELLKKTGKFIVKTLDDEQESGLEPGEDVNSFLISEKVIFLKLPKHFSQEI